MSCPFNSYNNEKNNNNHKSPEMEQMSKMIYKHEMNVTAA